MFFNPTRQPATVSFRELHPSDTLRQTVLHNYIRKLLLTVDEFMALLGVLKAGFLQRPPLMSPESHAALLPKHLAKASSCAPSRCCRAELAYVCRLWTTLPLPTPDHYLPLLYVIGTRMPSDPVTFPVEGVDGGSISMLAV